MKKSQQGFLVMALVIIIGIVTLGVGGYFVAKNTKTNSVTSSPIVDTQEIISNEDSSLVATTSATSTTDTDKGKSTLVTKVNLKQEYKTEGITLCTNFPKMAEGYTLHSAYVTNEPSQSTHSSYWNTKTGNIYNHINPNENILLNYVKGTSLYEDPKINIYIYRFENSSELQNTFGSILGLNTNETEKILQSESGVKGYLKYIYKNKNNLVEVVGESEKDIITLANLVMNSCLTAEVYKSDTPKGFTAWRTKDLYPDDRKDYLRIADADITLNLAHTYFGSNPYVLDNTIDELYGTPIEETSMLFGIPTNDQTGRLRPFQNINLYVIKSSDKNTFLDFVRKYECFDISGCFASEYKVVSENKTDYKNNSGISIEKIAIKTSRKGNSIDGSTIYVYLVMKNNTIFALVNKNDEVQYINSIIENIKLE